MPTTNDLKSSEISVENSKNLYGIMHNEKKAYGYSPANSDIN